MILRISALSHVASRKSSPPSRRPPRQTHRGRLGETANARLIDSEGNAPIVPEDGGIRSDFVLEDHEFRDDKTCSLTGKNQIPGFVTHDIFATDVHIVDYRPEEGVFDIVLDDNRGTCLSAPYAGPSAPRFSNSGAVHWKKCAIHKSPHVITHSWMRLAGEGDSKTRVLLFSSFSSLVANSPCSLKQVLQFR